MPPFPTIHLLCIEESFRVAFEEARVRHRLPASVNVVVHSCTLGQLPPTVHFDTIVSPANSYGRLDGAFDDAISRALSPRDDYLALTRVVQQRLYQQWRGYAPPGSCTLVQIPDDFHLRSKNVWGARRVALCPTMRMPDDVRWDREIVYECIWSLLCAIDNHNCLVEMGHPNQHVEFVHHVLMTPLATGVGRVTAARWANQAVLAMKHFVEAQENPRKWSALEWPDFGKHCADVMRTWRHG